MHLACKAEILLVHDDVTKGMHCSHFQVTTTRTGSKIAPLMLANQHPMQQKRDYSTLCIHVQLWLHCKMGLSFWFQMSEPTTYTHMGIRIIAWRRLFIIKEHVTLIPLQIWRVLFTPLINNVSRCVIGSLIYNLNVKHVDLYNQWSQWMIIYHSF